MKSISKLLLVIPAVLALASCGNKEEDQRIADEVSRCAAIAQLMRGRDGVQVMFTSDQDVNDIYKPYQPPWGSQEKPIYTSSLLLSVWFELNDNKEQRASLEWSFDKEEYVSISYPTSDRLPHATVAFTKYPPEGEEVMIKMTATIKYKSATSYAYYDLRMLTFVPNEK